MLTTPTDQQQLRVDSALVQTRRELEELNGAIQTCYQRWDGDAADEARAVFEGLLRAVSNLTLAVERIDERLTGEIQRRRVLSVRVDSAELAS